MAPSYPEHPSIAVASAGSEERFQHLLLRLAGAAARENDPATLIEFVCREARAAFGATAAHVWKVLPDGSFAIESAAGGSASMDGLRLAAQIAPSLSRPVQHRTAIAIDDAAQMPCTFASSAHARSVLAAPIFAGTYSAVLALVDEDRPYRFSADDARKISAITAQTGLLLGAAAASSAAREGQRRSELLARCAQRLHSTLDVPSLCRTLAEHVRAVFNSRLAAFTLAGEEGHPELAAVASETNELAARLRELYGADGDEWMRSVAEHACSSEGAVWLPVATSGSSGENLGTAEVICAAVRTAQRRGAIIVFGETLGAFQNHDLALLNAIAEFGALALANCELYARAYAHVELTQEASEAVAPVTAPGNEARTAKLFELFAEALGTRDKNLFVDELVARLSDAAAAGAAILATSNGAVFEIAAAHTRVPLSEATAWRLGAILAQAQRANSESIVTGGVSELLGSVLATETGWSKVALARVTSSTGDLLGFLCVADYSEDAGFQIMLRSAANYAAAVLESLQLQVEIGDAHREWENLADALFDPVIVHDERHSVLHVNAALAEMLEAKPYELSGASMQVLATLLGAEEARECSFCGREQDQVVVVLGRTYRLGTSEVVKTDGSRATLHVFREITDVVDADLRYRELFANLHEGVYFSVPDGRLVEVNDSLVRTLGYGSAEELLLADPADVFVDRDARARFARALADGRAVEGWVEPMRRKDGRIIQTLQNAFAVRDASGAITQHRALVLDISEQQSSRTELQRERDFTSRLLETTRSIFLATTPEGTITYANGRGLQALQMQPGQLTGTRVLELISAERQRACSEALNAAAAGRAVVNLELQLRAGSAVQQFLANITPVIEQDEVTSLTIVLTDAVESAVIQAKLAQTEKLASVGQLVSGVAHEVNNPLTAILGFSDLLLNDASLPDHAKKDLRVIMQEAQRTKSIVQNLLSFARQAPPQRQPVDVNALLRNTVQLRAYDLANKRIKVAEQFAEPLPPIIGDTHQLQQVFLNILNNAFDAVVESGRQGRIEVSTGATATHIEVSFRDNGPGVSQPDRIFDPFFTTKEPGKGTGLGLSICFGIVRQHGGEIICRNNPDGAGATFTVRLPIAAGEQA